MPSVPEIRYLLARLLLRPPMSAFFIIAWSLRRRQHQADAAIVHYSVDQIRNHADGLAVA